MRPLCPALLALALSAVAASGDGHVHLSTLPDRVRVEIDGKLFTEYVFSGASRPYFYPVLAADGTSLTRDFPMQETPGEEKDHPHQRGLMLQHANLNDVDFWNEPGGGRGAPPAKGRTVQFELVDARSGDIGVLHVRNRYVAPDGRIIATDDRVFRFQADGSTRSIDTELTYRARADQPLTLGDNKDGMIAIRVPHWMTLPHRVQGRTTGGGGHLVTARGRRDAEAWGTRAEWCAYFAARGGTTYGIAIFDHPRNVRHPTWWMARDYGLLAANSFGQYDFERATASPGAGNYTVPAAGTLTLRHRFCFFLGTPEEARLSARYATYAER